MKYILLFILLFTACSAPKNYILNKNEKIKTSKHLKYSIGIKEIELPQYLKSRKIPFLKNKNEIIYLKNKKWATYLDEELTSRVISTIQKTYNTPKVYKYPHYTSTKPDIIIQINITKFIVDKNRAMLDATFVKNQNLKQTSKLFSQEIELKSKDKVVEPMNRLFSMLEDELIIFLEK